MFSALFGGGTQPAEQSAGAEEPTCKILAVYAHKGGVAKTTNVIHIAHYLALEKGKKVLMVDGDPQCTLSESVCSEAADNMEWRAGVDRGDIYTAWEAAYQAMGAGKQIPPAALVLPDRADMCTGKGGGLFLLPGSLQSFKVERMLAYAQDLKNRSWLNDVEGFGALKDSIGIMRQMILATAKSVGADLVIVDMGPAICDLNMNLLCSSDYFIVPAMPDRYSKSSLRTLACVLTQWATDQQKLCELSEGSKCPLKSVPPKFAGVVYGRVPVSSQGKPIYVNAMWMEACGEVVREVLMPGLVEYQMTAPKLSHIQDDDYSLEQIPQFTKVHEMSMRCYAPVFNMPEDMVYDVDKDGNPKEVRGKALKDALAKGQSYKVYFKNLCDRLLTVIGEVGGEED